MKFNAVGVKKELFKMTHSKRHRPLMRLSQFRYIVWLLLIYFLSQTVAAIAQESVKTVPADSVEFYRHKYRGKKPWEHIVSFPGTVASVPFVLAFKGIAKLASIGFDQGAIRQTLDSMTIQNGTLGIRPRFTARDGYGVMLFKKGLISANSALFVSATATIHSRQTYRLWWRDVEFSGGLFFADLFVRYRKLLGENFYGIGPDAISSNRSNYDYELFMSEFSFGVRPVKGVAIRAALGFDANNILNGSDDDFPTTQELFGESDLPGLIESPNFFVPQLLIKVDTRNREGHALSGVESYLAGKIYKQTNGDQFDFWKLTYSLRKYLHLFENRVLLLRFTAEMTEPFSDKEIPFYYLATLGHHATMRGFKRGRFFDRDLLLLSAEYRIPMWHHFTTSFFVDAGQVAGNIVRDFQLDEFRYGYGTGLRYWTAHDFRASLEFGFSEDGFRIYLSTNFDFPKRRRD